MRARIIRPGFFENESLAEVGPTGMLLFAGLWMLADREGRLKDRPPFIKGRIFPYFDCDVDSLLTELARRGFIIRYSVDGGRYISIVNWDKHQKAHPKDSESVIPPPPPDLPEEIPGNPRKVTEAPEPSTETPEPSTEGRKLSTEIPELSGEAPEPSTEARELSREIPGNSGGIPGIPLKHKTLKILDRSLDQELSRDQEHRSLDQEPSRDQEPKIADQTPSLVVNKAITRGESKPKATAPKPAMATRLPDSWPLTPEREQYAIAQGVNPERTHQDFCDYWHAKAGPNARKLDWDATWRTWCRRAAERGYGPSRASPGAPWSEVPMSKADLFLAAVMKEAAMKDAERLKDAERPLEGNYDEH